jgi:hypothetical protein
MVPAAERPGFLAAMDDALVALASQPGCHAVSLGQSTDDPLLLLLRSEWAGIGAYRRALSSWEVKTQAVPVLSRAIDEPSAFESVRQWDGERIVSTTAGLAADADQVSLGHAAGPDIAPLPS